VYLLGLVSLCHFAYFLFASRVTVSSFWDAGFDVGLGDAVNGFWSKIRCLHGRPSRSGSTTRSTAAALGKHGGTQQQDEH
jgi:hypothetical protein